MGFGFHQKSEFRQTLQLEFMKKKGKWHVGIEKESFDKPRLLFV